MQEPAESAELGDALDTQLDLGAGLANEKPAQHNALVARCLLVEAAVEVEQRHDAAIDSDLSGRRRVDAGQDPQQRRLARPVVAEESKSIAGIYLEIETAQRVDFDRAAVLAPSKHSADRRAQ